MPFVNVKLAGSITKEQKKEIAKEIEGGGGGQPHFATAVGKKIDGLEKALQNGKEILESRLVMI